MTARKIAVAVVLCGVVLWFMIDYGLKWYRERSEPIAAPEPEPDVVEGARLETATSLGDDTPPDAVPWTVALASPDLPLGASVSIAEFGDLARGLSMRQRGDVVAAELRVVAHREDLPETTVVAYVGDTGDDFTLEPVTLHIRLPRG